MQQVATSLREAWSALRRTNLGRAEEERLPVSVSLAEGDQVFMPYSASAKRRNKHYMASEGPCTATKVNGNEYEVRDNATTKSRAPQHQERFPPRLRSQALLKTAELGEGQRTPWT